MIVCSWDVAGREGRGPLDVVVVVVCDILRVRGE